MALTREEQAQALLDAARMTAETAAELHFRGLDLVSPGLGEATSEAVAEARRRADAGLAPFDPADNVDIDAIAPSVEA
ncbi:MAG: hypothetical protein S0880_08685 [Actinomycetota bacterium]|nr:hypothetical protein [Actinomycetota bacterium]